MSCVEEPINKAIDNYNETKYFVGLLYVFLFTLLVVFGGYPI